MYIYIYIYIYISNDIKQIYQNMYIYIYIHVYSKISQMHKINAKYQAAQAQGRAGPGPAWARPAVTLETQSWMLRKAPSRPLLHSIYWLPFPISQHIPVLVLHSFTYEYINCHQKKSSDVLNLTNNV